MRALVFVVAVLLALPTARNADGGKILATSGFNDAIGLNSNPEPDSPFEIGTSLHNEGVGEPGWDLPWQQLGGFDDRVPVQTEWVFEGDAAIRLFADRIFGSSMERAWFDIVPKVRVDQYVLVRPAAGMAGQVGRTGNGEVLPRMAARWQIGSDGRISVREGARSIDTGFFTLPNVWNKYSVIVDTESQTWEFLFNDQKFETADPLPFMNQMFFVDRVNLMASGTRNSYIDMITVSVAGRFTASDLTDNGFVDFEDLTVLLANWNRPVAAEGGNLVDPENTLVNFEDLTVLLAEWTGPGPAGSPEAASAAPAVPEPSTFCLALCATFGLCRWRRGRR